MSIPPSELCSRHGSNVHHSGRGRRACPLTDESAEAPERVERSSTILQTVLLTGTRRRQRAQNESNALLGVWSAVGRHDLGPVEPPQRIELCLSVYRTDVPTTWTLAAIFFGDRESRTPTSWVQTRRAPAITMSPSWALLELNQLSSACRADVFPIDQAPECSRRGSNPQPPA